MGRHVPTTLTKKASIIKHLHTGIVGVLTKDTVGVLCRHDKDRDRGGERDLRKNPTKGSKGRAAREGKPKVQRPESKNPGDRL